MSVFVICILVLMGCYVILGLIMAYIYLVVDKRPVVDSERNRVLRQIPAQRSKHNVHSS